MTHVLFEEDGAFKAGTVLSDAGTPLQVEHASGRRSKVKSAHVLLRFDAPEPGEVTSAAQRVADGIDVDFLWECAPQDEFGFLELATDYFGRAPTPSEATGLLLCLHGAPVYFHRKGRGRFRPAPPDTLKAALAALDRKREQEARIERDARELLECRLPEPIARAAPWLLARPDKQSIEWRTLDRACHLAHATPERVLLAAGAFGSARELHRARFAAEWFPRGTGFAAPVSVPEPAPDALPLADVRAFSIDDSSTTEIDDCLSVSRTEQGRLRIGIHIAAPALGIANGAPLDAIARERMSTVYMPGDKITMLPDEAIAAYSLDEGRTVPALSLYVELDASGRRIVARRSVAERIRVAANLRHDRLDALVDVAVLERDTPWDFPYADELRALWPLTLALCAEREKVRGKPEPRFRTDFSFRVEGEHVEIVQRRRDAPLDRIVAEMMILANSEWGRLLAERRAPGIYRSQQAGRVRTTSHPLAHQGLGVAQYAWCTSPLRRYVDLVNQRQLLAVVAGEKPPFAANDAELFAIMSTFDTRYGAYGDFQTRMERWWCLRWLQQNALTRVEAVVVREDLVRLSQAPLYFRVPGLPALAPGRRIVVDILDRDEIALDVSARFVEIATAAPLEAVEDAAEALEELELDELDDDVGSRALHDVPDGPAAAEGAAGDAPDGTGDAAGGTRDAMGGAGGTGDAAGAASAGTSEGAAAARERAA